MAAEKPGNVELLIDVNCNTALLKVIGNCSEVILVKFVTFSWRDTVPPMEALTVAGEKAVVRACPET